ncbi:hypothetical protein BDW75DRAFT_203326 [Aspergillus navahoensis]
MPSSRKLRAPPRHVARPQFASTPRFLFAERAASQLKELGNNDSILPNDEADLLANPRPTSTPARDSASRRKEVIEDSGSDLDVEQDFNHESKNRAGDPHEDIPSSPPPNTTEVDAEIQEQFRPARHRSKRRRVSVSVSATLATPEIQKRRQYDAIETSSPERTHCGSTSATNSAINHERTSPTLPYRTTPQSLKTPRPQPLAPEPAPATPATAKPSVRSYPRFLVSSATQPPPKPTFVLPRSPSPDQTGDPGPNTIPILFSPSSHALRRRGRQRLSAPSYIPGGMASEVRSWVLEMGTKREQQMQIQTASGLGRTSADVSSIDSSRYSYMLRISDVRQSALGSCGPLAFAQGQAAAAGSVSADDTMHYTGLGIDRTDNNMRNILLMGAPRLRVGEMRPPSRVPSLQVGDVVGILRGLVWEIPGGDTDMISVRPPDEHGHEQILRGESERFPGSRSGRWLVGMEWEIISSA